MTDSPPQPWTDDMSGRERVRAVVETLEGPATVQEIAEQADTSRNTAADELERLERDKWVQETTVDGKQAYDLYPVRLFMDEVITMAEDHDKDELERQLIELTEEQETLCDEWDVDGLDEFREELAEEDFTAAELRERRNVIDTWKATDTEIDLVRQALQLYDKVEELQPTGDGTLPQHA
ncbi:hypothetical protein SAMN05216226_10517 [Halovenus aranensis]|uniref:ArsR family transcriptional regulator n=2 Tax=Halovenus aranensis TaxID=890420 RepID=A0A1G8UMZ9_9EURY|nr:hypothetical protein SAMN05216226_10517 [Halovenus aranensis]